MDLVLRSRAGGVVRTLESALGFAHDAGRAPPVPGILAVPVCGAIRTGEARSSYALDATAEAGVAGGLEACPTTPEAAGNLPARVTRVLSGCAPAFVVSNARAVVGSISSPPPVLAAPPFPTRSPFTAARAAFRVLPVARLTDVEALKASFCGDLGRSRLFTQSDTDRRGRERGSGKCLKRAPP
jgi:hypothetical protein